VGALTSVRLDVEAFLKIAKSRPDWTMVLVGPEDDVFKQSELHQMQNVIFCGRKNIREIPAYIQAMDVCLNLQVINDITIGNYPLKIDEYLALGKPVVATRTIGMKPFINEVYMTEEGGDYAGLIEQALHENNAEKIRRRISLAEKHSWKNVLENIYQAIEKTMLLKNGSCN
jgi:glycosyltransferase involved in cell wall biosynthesis